MAICCESSSLFPALCCDLCDLAEITPPFSASPALTQLFHPSGCLWQGLLLLAAHKSSSSAGLTLGWL